MRNFFLFFLQFHHIIYLNLKNGLGKELPTYAVWKVFLMRPGNAFELLVKRILLNIGFSEVMSDGLYIYDGAPGQMIQGLGEAHNADVLLEPPVQTPFYS